MNHDADLQGGMDSSASGYNQLKRMRNRGTRKRSPSVKSPPDMYEQRRWLGRTEQAEDLHGTKSAPNGINVPGQCTREVGQLGGSTADSYETDQTIRRTFLSMLKTNLITSLPATDNFPKMMTSEG